MKKNLQITAAEWDIMKVVWERAPITVNDVADALSEMKGWHPKTVRTMLNRLVKKEILESRIEEKVYHYVPLVTRDECVCAASESFLDRIFDGALTPMLSHFVKQQSLTPEQKAELKRMLEGEDS